MTTEQIKYATRRSHAQLEKLVVERIRQTNTPEKYLKLLSSFNGYGEPTHHMWAKFKDGLNSYTDDAAVRQEVIDAANDTFGKFKNWIIHNERTR
jgi:heme oxygenase